MAIRKGDRLKKLREALLRRREVLLEDLRRLTGSEVTPAHGARFGDLMDRAYTNALLEDYSTLTEAGARELAEIEEALRMMDEGNYGKCQKCERPIPVARLRAVPTATHCVRCRTELDRLSGGASGSYSRIPESALVEDTDESDDARNVLEEATQNDLGDFLDN